MVDQPLVSIIIVTYNSSKFVEETLESVKNLDYNHDKIEVIISDDCSRDHTPEICKKWIENNKHSFYSCHFIQTLGNKGIAANYNYALKHTKGEWIKYIAGDDRLKPNCISTFVNNIESSDNIICCYWERFEKDNLFLGVKGHEPLKEKNQLKAIVKSNFFRVVHGPTLFLRRSFLIEQNGFDEKYMFAEDYPLCMRYLINGGHIKQIEKPLVEYRCYSDSVSAKADDKFIQSLYNAVIDFLPKAALKCKLPFHWYHYKLLSFEISGKTENRVIKVLIYLLKIIDYLSYKNKLNKF